MAAAGWDSMAEADWDYMAAWDSMAAGERESMAERKSMAVRKSMEEWKSTAEREPMAAAAAEGESMAEAEAEEASMAEAEAEAEEASMAEWMAAAEWESMAAAAEWERRCTFRDCVCRWFYNGITRVAPGIDYIGIPADADHHPAWSLLVGVTDGASLRLSRIRVARSGRILGRSDDKLEVVHDLPLPKLPGYSFNAGAALAPDGRSLCVLHTDDDEQPQATQLSLQLDTKELRLPEIEGTSSVCMPISAAGDIWALSATLPDIIDPSDDIEPSDDIDSFSFVMRRLLPEPGGRRWEQVGDHFTSPFMHHDCPPWSGRFLQGYAVLPDTNLILVSFQQYGLFFTFAPDSGCWTRVHTDQERARAYLPIQGRGVYFDQHVCTLCENTIYAYKLIYHHHQDDGQGTLKLSLDPPIEIDSVCPFTLHDGYGFLTRLADRLACSVWISLAWRNDPCPCEHLHAIVTTFHLREPAKGGIDVLHSTYRRLDMVPDPPNQMFCFLQSYEDEGSPALLQPEEDSSLQHVNEPSKMLGCCSLMKIRRSLTPRCFECGRDGHIASQCTQVPSG